MPAESHDDARLIRRYEDRTVTNFSDRALKIYLDARKRKGMPTDADTICEAIGIHRATFFRKMARLENGNGKRPVMSDDARPSEELGAIHQRAIAKSEAARNENQLKRDSKLRQNRDERQMKKEAERKPIIPVMNAYREGFRRHLPDVEPIQWSSREWSQAKMLITNVGPDRARVLVEYIFKNWGSLRARWKLSNASVPTMGIILGFGVQLIGELAPKTVERRAVPVLIHRPAPPERKSK